MKLLLISPSYAPVLGGLQTVTHQVAQALANKAHEVKVVTNRYPRSLPAEEVHDGVPVQRWPFFDSFGEALGRGRVDLALASGYYNPAATARLSRLLTSFRPDVVNLHFPEPRLGFVLKALRRSPVRLVVSLHGDDIERWFRGDASSSPQLDPVRELLRAADAVTACSRYLLTRALALEPSISSKAAVIHNAVESSRFLDRQAHRHPRPYVFAYGRFTYKKGFDLLLQSFASVGRRFPEVDLIVAGVGEQTEELVRLRAALRLEDRVVFYGRASPEEVVRLLNGCCLTVIPSREEPFGIVAVEALASGGPVVVTRVGGLPEVAAAAAASCVGEAPAIHWANPEPSDLERAMVEALSQPPTRRARAPVLPGFSLPEMTRSYQQVLEGRPFAA
jgi:glycogen synthase